MRSTKLFMAIILLGYDYMLFLVMPAVITIAALIAYGIPMFVRRK